MGTTKVSFPGLGISFDISSVAFKIGGIEIYWYGLIIASAMMLCGILALKHCKEHKFSQDLVYDILFVSLPSAIVGARLYYVLCEWSYYSQDLSRIFDTRSGGLAIYGGVIGAYLGAYIMCRIRKIPFSVPADYCIAYIPLGQAIGRWGNFFNQEAFGTTTNLPWGMTSDTVSSYLRRYCPELDSTMPVHPTFLYESICNLIIFFLLLKIRKKSKYAYETTCCYMILYGTVRFFLEGLRTDSLYLGSTGIRTSQLLSFILILFGLVYIAIAHYKNITRVDLPERFLLAEAAKEAEAAKKKEEKANVATAEATTETKEEVKEESKEDKEDEDKSSEEKKE